MFFFQKAWCNLAGVYDEHEEVIDESVLKAEIQGAFDIWVQDQLGDYGHVIPSVRLVIFSKSFYFYFDWYCLVSEHICLVFTCFDLLFIFILIGSSLYRCSIRCIHISHAVSSIVKNS